MENIKKKSGYVALVGQPNVGKSTLLNALLGRKISITSRKPQTTRQRILGIKTIENAQIIYIDLPGLHLKRDRALNRYMNRVAQETLRDVNVILFMVEGLRFNEQDEWILSRLKNISVPVILVINKIDQIKDLQSLLPHMQKMLQMFPFHKIIPISAARGTQLQPLENEILACLPEDVHYYPPEQFTDRSDRFMAAEMIREKLTRLLGEELPYAITVVIENFSDENNLISISAIIFVEKESQKPIVIGHGGALLKQVGQKARLDMEKYFDKKVFLKLWVKVKEKWPDSDETLRQFGYE